MKTTTGTITTTLAANGVSHALTLAGPDIQAVVGVSGTYTTPTVMIEGRMIGGTIWYPLFARDRGTGAQVGGASGISVGSSTTASWLVDTRGLSDIRVYASAGTPTSMLVEVTSGQASDFGGVFQGFPFNFSSASSFAAGLTFSGATGINVLSIPDNLADALSVSEASTAYLTFITTDGSEAVQIKKNLTFSDLNVVLGTATGTKIGTATTQKLAFYNSTPIVQPANTVDYLAGLVNLGLRASGGTAAAAFPGLISSSSPTGGIGYATGAGGTVTQITSRTTSVILNTVSGNIVLFSAAGSATPFSFTLTNSAIAAGDTVILSQKSGTDKYTTQVVTAVGVGSCQITLANASGTTTEQPVFNFNVIKGVAA